MLKTTLAPATFRLIIPAAAIIPGPDLSKKCLYIPALTNIYYNYKKKDIMLKSALNLSILIILKILRI